MLLNSPRAILLLALAVSLLPSLARADAAQDQYQVAAGHYSQSRWELACDEFQAFLRDHPDHPLLDLSRVGLLRFSLPAVGHFLRQGLQDFVFVRLFAEERRESASARWIAYEREATWIE